MKKIISVLSCGALLLSCSILSVYADEPVPVQLEDTVYQQLLTYNSCDTNGDGIITEEEFRTVKSIRLNLNEVQSLDFLKNADSMKDLYLKGGNFSDFSFLKDFSRLETLQLSEMPQVTDVSFIKDMDLIYCFIDDLENITDEQRLAVARFCEDNMQVGCSQLVGMLPIGMFYNSDDFIIKTSDKSKLDLEFYDYITAHESAAVMYASKPGQAEYTISYKDEIIHKGTVNIKENQPVQLSETTDIRISKIFRSFLSKEGKTYVICDNKLCSLDNGRLNVVKTDVKDISDNSLILFTDGHIEVNGEAISNVEDIFFTAIEENFCASDDGRLYVLKNENGQTTAELLYEGFGIFIGDNSNYFVSEKGEVILIESNKNSKTGWSIYPTGIMNHIFRHYNYFIDENKVLYEYHRYGVNAYTAEKIASDVEYVGYRYHSDGNSYSSVYIKSDGSAYSLDLNKEVELVSEELTKHPFRNAGIFTRGIFGGGSVGFDTRDYHISNDDILYIDCGGVITSACDVDNYICSEYAGEELQNVYFSKTDGTVWFYSFADNSYHAVTEISDRVMGDVNGDGSFNTADIVLMQKYLLGSEKSLDVPQNADLCKDNVLDVFDLVCMRKLLIHGNEN